MRDFPKGLVLWASLFIVSFGGIFAGIFLALGRTQESVGVGFGTGLAWLELVSTFYLLSKIFQSTSKRKWVLLLGAKSFIIYGLVAGAVLYFHLNIIGFLIGFSGLVVALFLVGIWFRGEVRG